MAGWKQRRGASDDGDAAECRLRRAGWTALTPMARGQTISPRGKTSGVQNSVALNLRTGEGRGESD